MDRGAWQAIESIRGGKESDMTKRLTLDEVAEDL